jgi:hexosaminidase
MHLDCCLHFFSVDFLKKYIDVMALHKVNRFHWHLTEDQGWRFESERFPLLNTKGAVREYSDFGKSYDPKPYGRVYTKQEMREIVEFCKERGINVIPEFDMPGHTSALLAAYPHLSCTGAEMKVKTHQGIYKDMLCLAKEEAFETVCSLLEEFFEIFPYEYIHIGSDETPHDRWEACPACQAKMKELGISDFSQYKNHFINRVIDFIENNGRHAIVWNDSARGTNLDKRAILQYWLEKDTKPTVDFINSGGKAILSPFSYYYFDYDYNITPLNRVHSYKPTIKGLSEEGEKNILGVEIPIWTEYINDNKKLERYLFPRAIAAAHTAKGEEVSYEELLIEARRLREEMKDIAFEREEMWSKPRIVNSYGWLKFIKEHYGSDYIKGALGLKKDEE